MNTNTRLSVVLLALLLAGGPASLATDKGLPILTVTGAKIMSGGSVIAVTLHFTQAPTPPYSPVLWYKNEVDCPDSTHVTSGGHYFSHTHKSLKLTSSGVMQLDGTTAPPGMTIIDENGISHNNTFMTTANVTAVIDKYYADLATTDGITPYTSSGSEDMTINCHGYSLGYGTWIQDMKNINLDDLVSTSNWGNTDVLEDGSNHSIRVSRTVVGETPTLNTTEKVREGRIYGHTWSYTGKHPSNATTQYKFSASYKSAHHL